MEAWEGGGRRGGCAPLPRLERVLERSMMVCLLGLFSTERLAREMSAVTRVMEILPHREGTAGWGQRVQPPPPKKINTHPFVGGRTGPSLHPLPPTLCMGLPGAGAGRDPPKRQEPRGGLRVPHGIRGSYGVQGSPCGFSGPTNKWLGVPHGFRGFPCSFRGAPQG